jgi:RNA recognition motif-containing protein
MSKKLYVGNLPYNTTNDELVEVFSQYGQVTSAQVMMDRDTGRSRGFAFVEMAEGGDQAIAAMNGAEFQGRTLTVNEARPREDRPRGDRPRGGGGGGGYGRRY